jgi:UDP-arabinose 4-epimerase
LDTRHVLVTGGAGYIGSHAVKALATAGFTPVVFDDLRAGHRWAVQWGPLIVGDLADTQALESAFASYPIGAVMHFAASAYVGESMRDPELYFRNNVAGSIHLLAAMHRHGVGKLVFSSSCATYGHLSEVPVGEDHRQQPVNPYGDSKLMVERMLFWHARAYGLKSVALRYFNAAGADPGCEIGEDHDPETHLIPCAIRAAMGLGPSLEVYGTDYPTPDGSAVRDYVHVTDLAEAHLAALRCLETRDGLSAFNLGTGTGHSVREVIAMVESVGGCVVPFQERPRRDGDPAELVANPSRARAVLGWQPCYSTLRQILETAWAWHRKASPPASPLRPPA